jgi:hypothetical protein
MKDRSDVYIIVFLLIIICLSIIYYVFSNNNSITGLAIVSNSPLFMGFWRKQ